MLGTLVRPTPSRDSYAIARRIVEQRGARADDDNAGFCIVRNRSFAIISFNQPNAISLRLIDVHANDRGYGFGHALLLDVLAIADALAATIHLVAMSFVQFDEPGLSQRDLIAWYRRHGFYGGNPEVEHTNPRALWAISFERPPQS